MSATFCKQAPAKINLFLHVTGKRDDGYHLLESLVCFADCGDVITAQGRDDDQITLTITGPMAAGLGTDDVQNNLVMRAAHMLRDASGTTQGADIVLEKHLPVASGIGGGSADAAATLRVLCRMWDIALPESKLSEIALALGADVPVCLHMKNALMAGIGEDITELPDLPPVAMLLINPGKAVSTPDVFRARDSAFSKTGLWDSKATFSSGAALASALQDCGNDLTLPASGILPEICDVLNAQAREDGCLLARMSGSGATCFALYDTLDQARQAANAIRAEHEDWWIMPTQIRNDQLRARADIGADFPG